MASPDIDIERYDAALSRLLDFGPVYGGGLSNHGPMALDALRELELPDMFASYVDRVSPTLESATETHPAEVDWRDQLSRELPGLVHKAGSQAGHGLLRVAHATRALRNSDSLVRRRELSAALAYWPTGTALASPNALTGDQSISNVLAALPRLDPATRPEGLLVHGLELAMQKPGVIDLVASIAPARDLPARFDELALAACVAKVRNTGLSGFTLLHGVTVSMIAAELLPYLDPAGQRQLEAAVAGFVVAAIVAFDDSPTDGEHGNLASIVPGTEQATLQALATTAATGADDHDIKFADACARLFARTGSVLPIQALAAEVG